MEYADTGSRSQGSNERSERSERISPREGELIKLRDTRALVQFHLLTGDVIEGAVRWYDGICIHVVRADRSEVTLFYSALAYYMAKIAAPGPGPG
jgi:sRNA-binding regulator protein Hfq